MDGNAPKPPLPISEENIEATVPFPAAAPGAEAPGPEPGTPRFAFLSPPLSVGEIGRLADYRVIRLIGEGGMGLVFLAEDTRLARPVALKVIRPELAGAHGIAERFTREARATAAIKHDHIVTIYQVGEANGVSFLAMEHLQGLSLARWLERGRAPSVDLVLRIGREIAAGLDAAHRRGMVHRDIKPANIWLEAPTGRVKVLDFGQVRSEHDESQITQSGTIIGTPAYMSPEQARGEKATVSSDLFSLGCVLYRLCAGQPPFQGKTILAVLTALASGSPRPLGDYEPRVQPALADLVMRLLSNDPARRPASAQAVVREIKAIERNLLLERQNAELPEVGARPGEPTSMSSASAAASSAAPPARRILAGRRGYWLAAAGLGLLAAAIATPVTVSVIAASRRSAAENRAAKPRAESAPAPVAIEPSPSAAAVQPPAPTAAPTVPPTALAVSPIEPAGPPAAPASQVVDRGQATPALVVATARPPAAWDAPVDPDGDCLIRLDPTANNVRIVIPGTPHALSAELGLMNAPRVLRNVAGDFEARVTLATMPAPAGRPTVKEYAAYHGAGLLVWQDEANYVRLEIAAEVRRGKLRSYANFEYRKDGALSGSKGVSLGTGVNQLRLERRGDEILAAVGPEGARWTPLPVLSVRLDDALKIGVTAINTATKPMEVRLEDFQAIEQPRPARAKALPNSITP